MNPVLVWGPKDQNITYGLLGHPWKLPRQQGEQAIPFTLCPGTGDAQTFSSVGTLRSCSSSSHIFLQDISQAAFEIRQSKTSQAHTLLERWGHNTLRQNLVRLQSPLAGLILETKGKRGTFGGLRKSLVSRRFV